MQVGKISRARTLGLELVRQVLQEQPPEDEFFEFGSVHLAAQDMGRRWRPNSQDI